MELNLYQKLAHRTRNNELTTKDRILEGCIGACGEVGEISEHLKKYFYQGHDLNTEHVKNEMGDALWYMSQLADELGFTLDEVLIINIQKLNDRYPNGFEKEKSINRKEVKSGGRTKRA